MKALNHIVGALKRHGFRSLSERAPRVYFTTYKRHKSPMTLNYMGRSVEIHHRHTGDDLLAIWQCFKEDQYEIPKPVLGWPTHSLAVDRVYRKMIEQNEVPLILDGGANIGASSLWFRLRYPESYIVAVEPNPENIKILTRNVSKNNIEIVEGAIVKKRGAVEFNNNNATLSNYMVDLGGAGDSVYSVEGLNISDILDMDRIKATPFILKLDIEGAEKFVFESDVEQFSKFPIIIVELHDFMMPGMQVSSSFMNFHAKSGRDFLYWRENVISIDPAILNHADDARP